MNILSEIMSENIRVKITTDELKDYAAESARSIVIRHIVNGNSDDCRRDTTPEEAKTIERIIYGALLNIRSGRDIQATASAAEFIGMQFLPGAGGAYDEPHTNTYDTIYLPIKKWVKQIETKYENP